MSFAIGVALICVSLYLINHYLLNYWKRRNFFYVEPTFLIGNLGRLLQFKICFNEYMEELYAKHKDKKYVGIYFSYRPALVINDPEIIQQVVIKDFPSFHDRPLPINGKNDPISKNLFFLKGKKWRELRVKLTPLFSSGKLKAMFPILNSCGKVLYAYIDDNLSKGNEVLEFRDLLSRLTINNISSIAFGIDNDCINDRESVFRKMGIAIFTGSIKRGFLNFMSLLLPNVMMKLNMKFASKEMEDFFYSIVNQTIEYREKNNVVRNDFMQLMIQLKNQGFVTADKDDTNGAAADKNVETTKLTLEEIVAQAFVFFAAGFETSSSTMSFTLYELCKNPEIMANVQAEIDRVMAGERELTYDMLNEMKYLECCIDESLRKYPLVPVFRVTSQDFKLPNSDLIIEKGTVIQIPMMGIHRDPDIFEEPMTFKPERFMNSPTGNGKAKGLFYMPFGDGLRSCIGARMGKLQAKLGLALVLSRYNVEFSDKSMSEGEMTFDPKQLTTGPGKPLNLKVAAR